MEVELVRVPAPGDTARRELTVASQVLAERRLLAITAARVSPSPYIKNEQGERPSDPDRRKAWDRGVAQIESYRQLCGVRDPSRAFGREARKGAERGRQLQAQRRLLAQGIGRSMGIGR